MSERTSAGAGASAPARAVLFDFGGTLYDYRCLASAEAESLMELLAELGVDCDPSRALRAQRDALRAIFPDFLSRDYYLHTDLFDAALAGTLEALGTSASPEQAQRYRRAQWQRHARDLVLRDGVRETLGALRERGLHLGIVSNIDDDQLEHLMDVAGVADLYDSILSSESAGSCKPHRGFFDLALERAGCEPAQALFVGDSLHHDIAGANRVGLRSVLIWARDDREPPADGPQADHVIRTFPELLELV